MSFSGISNFFSGIGSTVSGWLGSANSWAGANGGWGNVLSTAYNGINSIYSGIQSIAGPISQLGQTGAGYDIGMGVADMYREQAAFQADIIRQEADIDYTDRLSDAVLLRNQANQYQAAQTMKYAMTGVSIQGTPMLALDYTAAQAQLEVRAIRNDAVNTRRNRYLQAALAEMQGDSKAASLETMSALQGVNNVSNFSFGGFFDGINSGLNSIQNGWNLLSSFNGGTKVTGMDASYSTSMFA